MDYKNDMEKDARMNLQMKSSTVFMIKGDVEIMNQKSDLEILDLQKESVKSGELFLRRNKEKLLKLFLKEIRREKNKKKSACGILLDRLRN